MNKSPFATVQAALAEPANACDVLRIIAGDAKLDAEEKQQLCSAADELEAAQKQLILTYMALIETQQHLIAVNDQLKAARRLPAPPRWSVSGSLTVIPRDR